VVTGSVASPAARFVPIAVAKCGVHAAGGPGGSCPAHMLRPASRQLHAEGVEVRIGRDDRHSSIRRCRPLHCQCRPSALFHACGVIPRQGSALHYVSARRCLPPGRRIRRGPPRRHEKAWRTEPMEPGRPVSLPQRIWAVDISTRPGAAAAVCAICGPLQRSPNRTVRTTALHHLARHAHRDITSASADVPVRPPRLPLAQPHPRLLRADPARPRAKHRRGQLAAGRPVPSVPHRHTVRCPRTPSHSRRGGRPLPLGRRTCGAEEEQPPVWESACPACNAPDGACEENCPPQ
jgi:hypothetical protein